MYFQKNRLFSYALFLSVSVVSILSFYATSSGFIIGTDSIFHLNRIMELFQASVNHNANTNLYSFDSFGRVGSAVQNFYPNKMLFGLSFIYRITHNYFASIIIGLIIFSFLGLVISYECWLSFRKSQKQAIIFSLVFNLSTYHGLELFTAFDVGQWMAMLWMPIVFWVFLKYVKRINIKEVYY